MATYGKRARGPGHSFTVFRDDDDDSSGHEKPHSRLQKRQRRQHLGTRRSVAAQHFTASDSPDELSLSPHPPSKSRNAPKQTPSPSFNSNDMETISEEGLLDGEHQSLLNRRLRYSQSSPAVHSHAMYHSGPMHNNDTMHDSGSSCQRQPLPFPPRLSSLNSQKPEPKPLAEKTRNIKGFAIPKLPSFPSWGRSTSGNDLKSRIGNPIPIRDLTISNPMLIANDDRSLQSWPSVPHMSVANTPTADLPESPLINIDNRVSPSTYANAQVDTDDRPTSGSADESLTALPQAPRRNLKEALARRFGRAKNVDEVDAESSHSTSDSPRLDHSNTSLNTQSSQNNLFKKATGAVFGRFKARHSRRNTITTFNEPETVDQNLNDSPKLARFLFDADERVRSRSDWNAFSSPKGKQRARTSQSAGNLLARCGDDALLRDSFLFSDLDERLDNDGLLHGGSPLASNTRLEYDGLPLVSSQPHDPPLTPCPNLSAAYPYSARQEEWFWIEDDRGNRIPKCTRDWWVREFDLRLNGHACLTNFTPLGSHGNVMQFAEAPDPVPSKVAQMPNDNPDNGEDMPVSGEDMPSDEGIQLTLSTNNRPITIYTGGYTNQANLSDAEDHQIIDVSHLHYPEPTRYMHFVSDEENTQPIRSNHLATRPATLEATFGAASTALTNQFTTEDRIESAGPVSPSELSEIITFINGLDAANDSSALATGATPTQRHTTLTDSSTSEGSSPARVRDVTHRCRPRPYSYTAGESSTSLIGIWRVDPPPGHITL